MSGIVYLSACDPCQWRDDEMCSGRSYHHPCVRLRIGGWARSSRRCSSLGALYLAACAPVSRQLDCGEVRATDDSAAVMHVKGNAGKERSVLIEAEVLSVHGGHTLTAEQVELH